MDSEKRQLALINRRRPFANADDIRKMVGSCTLEPDELRAPKGLPQRGAVCLAAETELDPHPQPGGLETAGRGPTGDTEGEFPFEKAKITFAQVRKALELDESGRINLCRYEEEIDKAEKATLFEAKAFHTYTGACRPRVQLRRAGPERPPGHGR